MSFWTEYRLMTGVAMNVGAASAGALRATRAGAGTRSGGRSVRAFETLLELAQQREQLSEALGPKCLGNVVVHRFGKRCVRGDEPKTFALEAYDAAAKIRMRLAAADELTRFH